MASPKTVALPNREYIPGIVHDESLRNLQYPLDWQAIVDYVGMPCILKDAHGGGWRDVYVCRSLDQLLHHYNESGRLTMIVQEFIEWEHFVRCLVIGQRDVLPMKYDPRERKYLVEHEHLSPELGRRIVEDSLTLVRALGYDMNSMEWAVRDGVPYAIDFMNPAPDMDIYSLTPHYFEWAVSRMADLAIRSGEGDSIRRASRGAASSCSGDASWTRSLGGGEAAREAGGDPARGRAAGGESVDRAQQAERAAQPTVQGVAVTVGAAARSAASVAADAVRDAADAYHDVLTGDVAAESAAVLDAQIRKRDLFFGDRPLCTVLRPRFMSPVQYRSLQRRAAVLLGAFERAHEAAIRDPAIRAQFRLTEWEEELVLDDPGFPWPSPVSRLDAFFAGDEGLRFTEYNAETPAGPLFNDVLTEVFYALPAMRAFLRSWDVRPLPARHNVLHALLSAYQAWAGTRASPRIAVLDWLDVPTRREFTLFQEYAERQGVRCIVADPRNAELRGGKLILDGAPVDLIYKRVLISELIERCGLDHAVVRAVRERAVCMVNPFACKILHKKASLAVLSDERNEALYSAQERDAIAANIPWTRVVEERRTMHDGVSVDLAAVHRRAQGPARAQA